jgi:hypothetical protein
MGASGLFALTPKGRRPLFRAPASDFTGPWRALTAGTGLVLLPHAQGTARSAESTLGALAERHATSVTPHVGTPLPDLRHIVFGG